MDQQDLQQVRQVGYRDPLTRVWTGQVFRAALDEALVDHSDQSGRSAVFLISLRNFKCVNEDLGFEAGDTALQVVARRLVEAVGLDGFVARIGGDEFTVVLDTVADPPDASAAATLLLDTVEAPLTQAELPTVRQALEGRSLTATIGAALSGPGLTSDDLWRRADEATYPAEHGLGTGVGGPRVVLYGQGDPGGQTR